ncbi:MAG: radical SAM protein [Myxococcales bacterium]
MVLGELVPSHAHRWIASGALDAATDFATHTAWTKWLALAQGDAQLLATQLASAATDRGTVGARNVQFLSTHDHPRFATLATLGGARQRGDLGLLLLLTAPGVPMLLYGEEHGLYADQARELEDVWPDRMPAPFPEGARGSDPARRDRLRKLLALRAEHAALREGEAEMLVADGPVFAVRRSADGAEFDVVLNRGDEPRAVLLPGPSAQREILFRVGDADLDGLALKLGPQSGALVRRSRPIASLGPRMANVRLRDEEFQRSAVELRSLPSRIDFGITERCNLRCRHCLAFAPQRTSSGTARVMSPWLLDRIRGALGQVTYSCIGDLGEALTSPMTFLVLEALRGTPVIHLLTNGLLLDEAMGLRLAAAGVRSIQVSLDGATAGINDAIRVGGSFERIVGNLRALSRARVAQKIDLRLGVSCVVTRANLGELEPLARLCSELGLDWIKFEELAPVNEYAPQREPAVPPEASAHAVNRALEVARSLGLRGIDHTLDRRVWRCQLDAETARFLEDDQFANRSEIHPCRTPWEHVCVSPNGDVRLGDLFGPILGNLAEASLADLWNGPIACSERMRASEARPCGRGPMSCLPGSRPLRG